MARSMNCWLLLAFLIATFFGPSAFAQQPKQPPAAKAVPATKAAPAPQTAIPPLSAADTQKKNEILNSAPWKRAMHEFNEWLSAQVIYDKNQVEQIKINFANQVIVSTPQELQTMLADMQAKFEIIDAKEAQEARAWIGNYLSILSDKKRAEVISQLPNLETMTAEQLNQAMLRLEMKVGQQMQQAAQPKQPSAIPQNPFGGTSVGAQAYVADHGASSNSYASPYRPAGGKPFQDVQIGPNMQFYVGDGIGGGIMFSPSSW